MPNASGGTGARPGQDKASSTGVRQAWQPHHTIPLPLRMPLTRQLVLREAEDHELAVHVRRVLLHIRRQAPAQRRQAWGTEEGGCTGCMGRRVGGLPCEPAAAYWPGLGSQVCARRGTGLRMRTGGSGGGQRRHRRRRGGGLRSPAAALRSSAATPWNSTASSSGHIELGLVPAHCSTAGGRGPAGVVRGWRAQRRASAPKRAAGGPRPACFQRHARAACPPACGLLVVHPSLPLGAVPPSPAPPAAPPAAARSRWRLWQGTSTCCLQRRLGSLESAPRPHAAGQLRRRGGPPAWPPALAGSRGGTAHPSGAAFPASLSPSSPSRMSAGPAQGAAASFTCPASSRWRA